MSPRRATELTKDRLGLSDKQSQKIVLIAEDLFVEKDSLQGIRQKINEEILSQMKSETAGNDSDWFLRAKIFHA